MCSRRLFCHNILVLTFIWHIPCLRSTVKCDAHLLDTCRQVSVCADHPQHTPSALQTAKSNLNDDPHVGVQIVAVVVPRPTEGRPLSGREPGQTGAPRNSSNRALGRAHSRPAVVREDWISYGAGLFPSGFASHPTSLVFLLNWWGSLVLGEFEAATLAVASWVSERVLFGRGCGPFCRSVIE